MSKPLFQYRVSYFTAVKVMVNLFLRHVDEISETDGSFRAQITLRQEWNDPRLSFSGKAANEYLSLLDSSLIWTPDIFFPNAIEGFKHKILANNEFIRIYPNGHCLYSSRITLKLKCNLVSPVFPFEAKTCNIRLSSYGYTDNDVLLQWKPETPVQVSSKLDTQGFTLSDLVTSNDTSRTSSGNYGNLDLSFNLNRDLGYYWVMIYIPMKMLVIVSYMAFWVRDRSSKYMIAVAALLVGAMSCAQINTNLPKTSYTKAIDVWTGSCLTFMMTTLVLLVIIENICNSKTDEEPGESLIKGKDGEEAGPSSPSPSRRRQNRPSISMLERLAQTFYPIVFAIFCVLYFLTYCLLG